MLSPPIFISSDEFDSLMSWNELVDTLKSAHQLTPAKLNDLLLEQGSQSFLNRAAWIDQHSIGLKTVTIFPENLNDRIPSVQGIFILFDGKTGTPQAFIDGAAMTRWKTAADSTLGAKLLARKDAKKLLIIGAGTMAQTLVEAYPEVLPTLKEIQIWNRTVPRAEHLVQSVNSSPRNIYATIAKDLAQAIQEADIISCATMCEEPILQGQYLCAGQHIDLIGSYNLKIREADDQVLQVGRLFVDLRQTALETGELHQPIQKGIISEQDILGDLYELVAQKIKRNDDSEITIFKNAGGAHLDLMCALHALKQKE